MSVTSTPNYREAGGLGTGVGDREGEEGNRSTAVASRSVSLLGLKWVGEKFLRSGVMLPQAVEGFQL